MSKRERDFRETLTPLDSDWGDAMVALCGATIGADRAATVEALARLEDWQPPEKRVGYAILLSQVLRVCVQAYCDGPAFTGDESELLASWSYQVMHEWWDEPSPTYEDLLEALNGANGDGEFAAFLNRCGLIDSVLVYGVLIADMLCLPSGGVADDDGNIVIASSPESLWSMVEYWQDRLEDVLMVMGLDPVA